MSDAVHFDPRLNRRVRAGDDISQAASTYRLAVDALQRRDFEQARLLGRFTEDEARDGRELYPLFAERARAFLLREGVSVDRLDAEERRISDAIRRSDKSTFTMESGWHVYTTALDAFESACERKDAQAAIDSLEVARTAWRETHDAAADLVYGLLDLACNILGEDRIGEMWDHILEDIYPSRDRYDVSTRSWADSMHELVLDAAASLRGHLSGPARDGEIEIEEYDDRLVLRFDPCGSGGRTLRPDDAGAPARMKPPTNFAVTTQAHDWAWNTEGVCLYCAHCCQLQERASIRRLGYPVRVIEPPVWPDGANLKCTWTIYKDPTLVPDEAYRRVGYERPTATGRED
jgi:hypothetical protein